MIIQGIPNAFLFGAYAVDWLLLAYSSYWHYKDVVSTMDNIAVGFVEENPKMKPYVILGRPWYMGWGKFLNGGWIGLLAFVFPPIALAMIRQTIDVRQAALGNEALLAAYNAKHQARAITPTVK